MYKYFTCFYTKKEKRYILAWEELIIVRNGAIFSKNIDAVEAQMKKIRIF
jgi:hypothetical protein